jgi:hypothetical protein
VLPAVAFVQAGGDNTYVLVLCCYGLILLAQLALIYWVYSDARNRGNDKAGLWAVLVFLTPIIGLIIYLLVGRDQGSRSPPDTPSAVRYPPDDPTSRRF